jgi:O-antigen/teichoic acid export membrane protein
MLNPLNIIKSFLSGHYRTVNVTKNIILSLIFKGISILIGLFVVPILLRYLGTEQYGIWLTINSVLAWFLMFDLGIGNGLRNKLTESLAGNDLNAGCIYVSSSYLFLSIIVLILFVVFIILFPFINWTSVFNAPIKLQPELNALIFVVFVFFCFQFVLKLIGVILTADQKPAMNDLIGVLGSAIAVLIVFFISEFVRKGSILLVGVFFSSSPVIIFLAASFILFSKRYKKLRPSVRWFKISYIKDMFTLSFRFFLLQIIGVVVFSTSNIIIIQYLGPSAVTVYSIAYGYMSVTLMIFEIIRNPLWSAYTESYHKNDLAWIKRMTKYLTMVWVILTLCGILMIVVSQFIISVWVGKKIHVPMSVIILLGIYFSFVNWTNIFATLLSGVGKIKFQFYYAVVVGLLFIPLSILLCSHYGLIGMILSMIISMLPGTILGPIQYFKIVNKTDKGIWAE